MIRSGFFFNLNPKLVDPEFDNPEQCCFHEFSTFPCFRDECRNTDPDWYLEQDAIWAANENIEEERTDHNMRYHANFYEDLVLQEIHRCSKATFEQQQFLLHQISSFDSMLVELLHSHNYLEAIKYLSRFATRAKVWLGRAESFWIEGRKTFYEGCVEVAHILLMKQHDAIENIMEALEGTREWSKSHRIVNEWIKNVPKTIDIDDINSPPVMHLDIEEKGMVMENEDECDSIGLGIQTQLGEQVEESTCKDCDDENYAEFKFELESESNSNFSKANSNSRPFPTLQIERGEEDDVEMTPYEDVYIKSETQSSHHSWLGLPDFDSHERIDHCPSCSPKSAILTVNSI